MKISAIKQQARNPERVSVFVDGKYSFSLGLGELLKEKIKNGDELDKAAEKRLKKISADGKLRARALEWVLNRPRSIREFRDYMFRKKADPGMTDVIIKDFSKRGYLNEVKFSQWLIDVRSRANKSDRAIRAELFKKGISREVVEELMADTKEEEIRLKSLVAQKSKLTRYQKDPDKLKMYLLRQGFSYDQIKKILK